WDVVCLQFVWNIARLHVHNLEKAASVFDGWHIVLLGVLWLASAWLFRAHSDPSWHRMGDRVRNLVAAVSFFVGVAVGSWSLSGDPPPLSTFPVFWIITLAAVAGPRATALPTLWFLTSRGMSRRNPLIVGTGPSDGEVVNRLHAVPEYGCVARGFLCESPGEVGRIYQQVPVIGTFADLARLVESEIDLVL